MAARTGTGEPGSGTETVAGRARRDTHSGGHAERAVVPAGALVPVPAGVGLPEATALVNDGMTAMLVFEAAGVRPGEWVLVAPAGGGLGNLLVQLAHAAGAHVVGAARGPRKLTRARHAGADAAVDYERDDWHDQIRTLTGGRGPDVVLDGVGGRIGRTSLEMTARGGRFIGYGGPGGAFTRVDDAGRRGVHAISLFDLRMASGDDERLAGLALAGAAAGRITPIIGQTLPLERAAGAHAMIEARAAVGKTLVLT